MSKLKASWPVRILTKKVCLTFSAHSDFLMNTDGLLKKKISPETLIQLSFRIQKLYEAQFVFET